MRAAEISGAGTGPRVVVVSAADGIQDLIVAGIEKARAAEPAAAEVLSHVRSKHRTLAGGLALRTEIQWELHRDLETMLRKLEKLFLGVSFTGEVSPPTRSRIVSFGERLSAAILAAALRGLGSRAENWESDAIGMITDEEFENATVNLTLFKTNFAPFAQRIKDETVVPVITGGFGCTPKGRISAFGRNGSDYSASAIAYALGAKTLEFWNDREGFLSADPGLVPNPVSLPCLSYAEAAELSYFGEKVLHPRALEPLSGMRTTVAVKTTAKPDGPGTRLTAQGIVSPKIVKSVAATDDIAMLSIHGPGVGFKPGIIGRVGRNLSDLGINIYSVITSQTCINLLLDRKDARRGHEALVELTGGVIQGVDLREDVSLIAVVGAGFLKTTGIAARILGAVSRESINVELISTGASEVAAYLIVERPSTGKAVRAIHREFFG